MRKRRPDWSQSGRLRKGRREAGLKQERIAELLGVRLSTYSAWETGRNTPDMLAISPKLEEITGIDRLWFIGWADGPNDPRGPDGVESDAASASAALAQSVERFTRNENAPGSPRDSPSRIAPVRPLFVPLDDEIAA